jgi:hypothetical protein
MRSLRAKLAVLFLLSAQAFAGGCASPVPGQSGIPSGRVITVVIQCDGIMYPNYYYYFLINRLGPNGYQHANGPIPVIDQAIPGLGGYGNGFATGSNTNNTSNGQTDYGLTDYVVYNSVAGLQNQIELYHINGDPNNTTNATADPQGSPVPFTLPDVNNPDDIQGSETLTFQLHVSQLLTPTETAGKTPAQIAALADAIQWIQVNIVATNYVPTSQAGANQKQVDSMGNSLSSSDLTSFVTIDLTQTTPVTSNGTFPTLTYPEPDHDIYPSYLPYNSSIDLHYWSITVSGQ